MPRLPANVGWLLSPTDAHELDERREAAEWNSSEGHELDTDDEARRRGADSAAS